MYLENNKPTFEIESQIVFVIHYKKDICEVNNNNCIIEDDNCKYIITDEYYDLFIKFEQMIYIII